MKKKNTSTSLFDWMDQKQTEAPSAVPTVSTPPVLSEDLSVGLLAGLSGDHPIPTPIAKESLSAESLSVESSFTAIESNAHRLHRPTSVEAVHRQEARDEPTDVVADSPLVVGVDAMNLVFQLYYALPKLTSPNGEPVGVIRGFLRDLLTLRKTLATRYLFVTFDLPDKTFRHELHTAYKANRPPAPADILTQILKLRPLLAALGIPVIAVPGFEADDLLATLTEQGLRRGFRCVVVTADKDCRQLLHEETVRIYMIRKKRFVDAATLREEWGIEPQQVVDYLSLVGDAADNVPGVPGIGPKSAKDLLNRFGSIERMVTQLERISNARCRKSLRESVELLAKNRVLIQLRRDVPCDLDWQAAERPIPTSGAADMLTTLGLAKLIPEFCAPCGE